MMPIEAFGSKRVCPGDRRNVTLAYAGMSKNFLVTSKNQEPSYRPQTATPVS